MIKRLLLSRIQFLLPAVFGLSLLVLSSCGSDETVDVGGDGASIVDGVWVLDSLSVDGSEVTVLADLEMSIDGGNINGNTGCNSFGGTLKTDSSGGASIEDLFMTERACVESERMAFEGTYTQALGEVDSWERAPALLTLVGPRAALVYVVADPPVNLPLEQTSWVLDTIFSGSGAEGAASSTDQQANAASFTISDDRVNVTADGCPDVQLDVAYERGDSGSFDVSTGVAALAPCGDANWAALVDGLLAGDSYAIDENRLTISSGSSLLIGLRGS